MATGCFGLGQRNEGGYTIGRMCNFKEFQDREKRGVRHGEALMDKLKMKYNTSRLEEEHVSNRTEKTRSQH